MKACPTGALVLVQQVQDIDMGLAVLEPGRCLRGPGGYLPGGSGGEDCRICVDQCPLGESALGIDAAGRVDVRPGCVGCGVCERACPTEPASIIVQPADQFD
jgi:ferredoxin-type protein NapG